MEPEDNKTPSRLLLSEESLHRSPRIDNHQNVEDIEPWSDVRLPYDLSPSKEKALFSPHKEKSERGNSLIQQQISQRNIVLDPVVLMISPHDSYIKDQNDNPPPKVKPITKKQDEVLYTHKSSEPQLVSNPTRPLQLKEQNEVFNKNLGSDHVREGNDSTTPSNYDSNIPSYIGTTRSIAPGHKGGAEIYFLDNFTVELDKIASTRPPSKKLPRLMNDHPNLLVLTQPNIVWIPNGKSRLLKQSNENIRTSVDLSSKPYIPSRSGNKSLSNLVPFKGNAELKRYNSLQRQAIIKKEQALQEAAQILKTPDRVLATTTRVDVHGYFQDRTDSIKIKPMHQVDSSDGEDNFKDLKKQLDSLTSSELTQSNYGRRFRAVGTVSTLNTQSPSRDSVREESQKEDISSSGGLMERPSHIILKTKKKRESLEKLKGFKAPNGGNFTRMYKRGRKIRHALDMKETTYTGSPSPTADLHAFQNPDGLKTRFKVLIDNIINGKEKHEGVNLEQETRLIREVDTNGGVGQSPLLKIVQKQIETGNKEEPFNSGKRVLFPLKQSPILIHKKSVERINPAGNKVNAKNGLYKDLFGSDVKLMERKVRPIFHLAQKSLTDNLNPQAKEAKGGRQAKKFPFPFQAVN